MLWVPVHPLDCPPNYIGCQADRAKPKTELLPFLQKWSFFSCLLVLLILDHGGGVESFPVNSFHVLTVGSLWKKKRKKKCHKIFVTAPQTISLQSPWTLLNHLGSTFCGSARPAQRQRHTGGSRVMYVFQRAFHPGPAIVRLLKRPIHPRACELDITIPITGLTRRVSAAHLRRQLFRRFWRRESAWHQPKVRTHLISLVAFVSRRSKWSG